jgi:RecB family exonuclease
LTGFEREALFQAAAVEASANFPVPGASSRLRPGLVAEMLRFYDQLRRQSQGVNRFEELLVDALNGGAQGGDRGSERLLGQTHFLAFTFREYERRVSASGACDEHTLREHLLAETPVDAVHHVVVAVADWIADPDGLFLADFDLLARLTGLEAIDVVCTETLLTSGFHERLREWLPGIEESASAEVCPPSARVLPKLITPPADPSTLWYTSRDREEELVEVARRIRSDQQDGEAVAFDFTAVVFKRPLPYLYLAPATLGAAGIPFQASAALPLAAEPTAAAVDLVLDLVESNYSRSAIVALLRSPHFQWKCAADALSLPFFECGSDPLFRGAVSALDRGLSDARYLGDVTRLEQLARQWRTPEAETALAAALEAVSELSCLSEAAPASTQLRRLSSFLSAHYAPIEEGSPFAVRERRARSAIGEIIADLAAARAAYHDDSWSIVELAPALRRWIEEATFVPETEAGGVHLLDDQAARFAEFEDLTIVGLVEDEWPERPRRNIFYPSRLLKALGWPPERDRHLAADARLVDLIRSPSRRVVLSTFTLDDEALVTRSAQLDLAADARLSTLHGRNDDRPPVFVDEQLAREEPAVDCLPDAARSWANLRLDRSSNDLPSYHGSIGPVAERAWSISSLERYLECPFKFFAGHVLGLKEEPDDEEVMDPRRQGRFMHRVFEDFFREWQAAGRREVRPENLSEADDLLTSVVDRAVQELPEGEAATERTRLLGSAAAAGLGDAVLRMEAERPIAVVERLLEQRFDGDFAIATPRGTHTVPLRGVADRIDLLEDGTFRVIDYKLGWPPNKARALQLPIYGICAEQRLSSYRGRRWIFGEAAYLAFKGPRRVVPLFASPDERVEVLARAQQRLIETLDAINRGEFPPRPDDVYRCETCSFASVCRKDYA